MGKNLAAGEQNLDVLLAGMQPVLHDDVFVFSTLSAEAAVDAAGAGGKQGVTPIMTFREVEGVTWILSCQDADRLGLTVEFPCRMITLNIHSALDAVGFLARVTTRLAARQIGVNPVSGFYHDHLFVPKDRAQDAMQELQKMILEQTNG